MSSLEFSRVGGGQCGRNLPRLRASACSRRFTPSEAVSNTASFQAPIAKEGVLVGFSLWTLLWIRLWILFQTLCLLGIKGCVVGRLLRRF